MVVGEEAKVTDSVQTLEKKFNMNKNIYLLPMH